MLPCLLHPVHSLLLSVLCALLAFGGVGNKNSPVPEELLYLSLPALPPGLVQQSLMQCEPAPCACLPVGPLGSPGFVAPEIIHGAVHMPSMDVFSLGVLLFIMLVRGVLLGGAGKAPERSEAQPASHGQRLLSSWQKRLSEVMEWLCWVNGCSWL